MSQTVMGAQKIACKKLGVTLEEYAKNRRNKLKNMLGIDWQKTIVSYNTNQQKTRIKNQLIRIALIILLGEKCVKCGYDIDLRALQVDHTNGGGTKEVQEFGGNNAKMWKYYLEHPNLAIKLLQSLCANCNTIKRYENKENVTTYPTDEEISEIRIAIKQSEVNIIG